MAHKKRQRRRRGKKPGTNKKRLGFNTQTLLVVLVRILLWIFLNDLHS